MIGLLLVCGQTVWRNYVRDVKVISEGSGLLFESGLGSCVLLEAFYACDQLACVTSQKLWDQLTCVVAR